MVQPTFMASAWQAAKFTYGVIAGLIVQDKSTYFLGKEVMGVGQPKSVAYLRDNPKLVEELKKKITIQLLKRKTL